MTVKAKPRKPRTAKDKWETQCLPHASDSKYWQWLRSASRRMWNKHPVKLHLKQTRRFKAPLGVNNAMVWAIKCECCGEVFRENFIEVDHIHACGSFKSWQEYTQWLERLMYVDTDCLRLLCKDCHGIQTYSERYGVSLEDAKKRKEQLKKGKK